MADRPRIVVAAAVIERNGAFLVTRRPPGVHLEGRWEFPGGKCETGEPYAACLAREIQEELDCAAAIAEEIFAVTHEYSERSVELHFFRCTLLAEPRPALGQEMRWAERSELRSLDFPPADEALIRLLSG